MNEHLGLLGLKVRDVVTDFSGVVTSVAFDLYGCVQAVVTPPAEDVDKESLGRWFDTKRLRILAPDPVMPQPTFASVPGPEPKPAFAQRALP